MAEQNDALRAAREATPSPHVDGMCLSRQELADAVNTWLAARVGRGGAVDSHYVGRLEQGRVRWPNADYRAAFAAVLGTDDLGFRSPTGHRKPVRPPGVVADTQRVRRSQVAWLAVRQPPGVRGRELSELAVRCYPAELRAPGEHVLAGPGWLLGQPIRLDEVRLAWSDGPQPVASEPLGHVLPLTETGERYTTYSRAVRDLVRPRLLENRVSYRLTGIDVSAGLTLTFGRTMFFDVFDVKQSIAHEFKSAWLAGDKAQPKWVDLPLRAAADQFNPNRFLMSPGISTLTIRRDPDGDHRFYVLGRDGGKVADGGGLSHVVPAGEFQPSSANPEALRDDFSLWRNIMREFSEELLGNPEHDGNSAVDYDAEPFAALDRARRDGELRMWHYGLVMEAIELGAAQLTVAVLNGAAFDRIFAAMVTVNDEGTVPAGGHPFTAAEITRLGPRMSASGLTLLELAWRDRALLLADPPDQR